MDYSYKGGYQKNEPKGKDIDNYARGLTPERCRAKTAVATEYTDCISTGK